MGVLVASTAWAGGATGTVGRKGKVVKVVDAFAYRAQAEMVGEGPRLRLRLSPVALDQKRLAGALDVPGELDRQMEGQSYVELELETDGRWTGGGMSTIRDAFCGWCHVGSQAEKARTRVVNGRVTGTIKASATDDPEGDGYDADLTLDVPIEVEGGTTALPAGGGEPGKAYQACLQAVAGRTEEAIVSSCFTRDDAWLAKQNLDYFEGEAFFEHVRILKSDIDFQKATITGGRQKGDEAELTVALKRDPRGRPGRAGERRELEGPRLPAPVGRRVGLRERPARADLQLTRLRQQLASPSLDGGRDLLEPAALLGQAIGHAHGRTRVDLASDDAPRLQLLEPGGQRLRADAAGALLELAEAAGARLQELQDQPRPGAGQAGRWRSGTPGSAGRRRPVSSPSRTQSSTSGFPQGSHLTLGSAGRTLLSLGKSLAHRKQGGETRWTQDS